MKKTVCLILTFCVLFAAQTPFYAAQTSKTLGAGLAYEFTNTDARVVSYINVSGAARYEYVTRDANGAVTDFGVTTGRFAVRGGGAVVVSVAGAQSAAVTYDNAKINVRETAGTALNRVTLARGETALFENASENTARIGVDNSGRTEYASYDCAAVDNTGAVLFYAAGTRYTTLSVPREGTAYVTALEGGVTLIYPSAFSGREITAQKTETPALFYFEMRVGQPFTITNASAFRNYDLITVPDGTASNNAFIYDYIAADEWGGVTAYDGGISGGGVTVKAGESMCVTPQTAPQQNAGGVLKFAYPAAWKADLSVTQGGIGKLTYREAGEGDTLIIENKSVSSVFTFRAAKSEPVAALDYTYGGGSFYDETLYAVNEPFHEMSVAPGYTWTFTVAKGPALKLWFPEAWLREGVIINGGGQPTLEGHILRQGASLTLTNTDELNEYTVMLANVSPGRQVLYDYAITENAALRYEADCSKSILTLPPDSEVTLTAPQSEQLSIKLPLTDAVTVAQSADKALERYALAPGESAVFTNTAEFSVFGLTVIGAPSADAVLDYLIKDDGKKVEDFGGAAPDEYMELKAGYSLHVTNADARAAYIVFPRAALARGLTAAKTDERALRRQTLTENRPLSIANADASYDYYIKLESADGAPLPPKCDYVLYGAKRAVFDYGTCGAGSLPLYAGGGMTLMAERGAGVTLCYPAEWQDKLIKITQAADAPLYRAVIKPGRRLKLENNSSAQDFIVKVVNGQYYLRYGADNSRITAGEESKSGPLSLPAKTAVTVHAAPGADLELLMPAEWARMFGVTR